MTTKKAAHKSTIEIFWKFVQDNPELAASVAMELVALAAVAIKNSSKLTKHFRGQSKKVPRALANTLPRSLPAKLKLLSTPKIQKRARPKRNTRSTKQAA